MFQYESLWDIYEVKFLFLFLSIVAAVMLGNYLYDKTTKAKKKDYND